MTEQARLEALIARAALDDPNAFSSLYDATSAKLLSVCMSVLNDQQAAEDALQDSYIKIWNKADQYQTNGMSPMTWLIAIARNTSIDRLRAQRPHHSALETLAELVDETSDPEADLMTLCDYVRIKKCLEELEDDKAEAVCAAYIHGHSYAELASKYNIPLNTVRTWLRRSLVKLKRCLCHE